MLSMMEWQRFPKIKLRNLLHSMRGVKVLYPEARIRYSLLTFKENKLKTSRKLKKEFEDNKGVF
jgi:hypothetical protein